MVLEMLILVFWEKKQTTIIRFPVRREMWDIGDSSYSGVGHNKNITNPNAKGNMNLDCGVGNITGRF